VIWLLALLIVTPLYPAASTPEIEELNMATAIAKAMKNNPTLYTRRLNQELFEISYANAWAQMWVPSISLQASSGVSYGMAQLPGSAADASNTSLSRGTPTSGLALTMGEYTIFNFGRDRDTYDVTRLEYERSLQSIVEIERLVRFQVIQGVFNLKTQGDLLEASQRSVDAAQAIYDLVRSRIPLGKATERDLSSVEVDLLNARAVLVQNQANFSQALWDLNVVLGDTVGTRYRLKTDIKYIKFRMGVEDVVAALKTNSPTVREAKKNLEQRRAEQRLAEKNALPLPTIKFSGVSVGYTTGATGTTPVRTTTAADSGNINVSAAMTLSIPLVGDGGFLFARTLRAAEVNTEIAEIALRNAANTTEASAQTLYANIRRAESEIEINEKLFKESTRVFESSLQALQSRQAFNRLDIKNALEQLRTAELSLTSSILEHYNLKLQLANLIGVDRFPEENL
jgi:outer membrane protein TolC